MAPNMQNPGVQAGASRDQFGGRSQLPFIAPGWRWQLIASRYRLPSSMARQVDWHCFGEGGGDD